MSNISTRFLLHKIQKKVYPALLLDNHVFHYKNTQIYHSKITLYLPLAMNPQKPKLLDQVKDKVRLRNYSYRTEKSYVSWVKRYILFHNKQHPMDMGKPEVEAFLTHLAVQKNVAAATQNQALSALLFLYNDVLDRPIGYVDVLWAKKPKRFA